VSNFTTTPTTANEEFAAGMDLIAVGQTNPYAEVFIGTKATYGLENWYPLLYGTNFGTPCAAYSNPSTPLFTRLYTNGFIAVDNSATNTASATLPTPSGGGVWIDYDGIGTPVTSPVTVQPHGARLLVQSPAGTTC
jgi:hypothetical protein